MSLQVNLLKKAEQRYQGIVSMKVMVLASVSVLVGITVLVLTLAGISKMTLNANLDRARREWNRLEPLSKVIRERQSELEANKKTLSALEGWSRGDHVEMYKILRAVQGRVPAKMELSDLFVGEEPPMGEDALYYVLRLSGRAQGELIAVNAKRQLSEDEEIYGFCGEVKLVSSQREMGDVWSFALEGRRPTGGGKK